MAKAIVIHINPYLPIPQLVERTMGISPAIAFPHPTPHPPPIALLSLPLALFNYQTATILWFIFEAFLLVFTIYLLFTIFGRDRSWLGIILITVMLLGWQAFIQELVYGQLMILILFLITGTWYALKKARLMTSGILLGLALSFKLIMWPILILLIAKKNWKALFYSLLTFVLANLAGAVVMGFGPVIYYYTRVGQEVSAQYQSFFANYSVWTVGWRLFSGTGSSILVGFRIPPLVDAPILAPFISAIFVLGLLSLSILYIPRLNEFDQAFGALITLSILVSPVSWNHYFTLLIIPLSVLAKNLMNATLSHRQAILYAEVCVVLAAPVEFLYKIIRILAHSQELKGADIPISFGAGLLTYMPMLAVLSILWLCCRSREKNGVMHDPGARHLLFHPPLC